MIAVRGRIGCVDEFEKFNELAAAMAVANQGMHLPGHEIDPGEQADRAVALVFVVAREACMPTRLGRQIRTCRCDRLDARLLIIRDDCDLFVWLVLRRGRDLLEDFHLAIDTQHLGHLVGKIRVPLLQVVAHLVRLDLLLIEDLANRALRQIGKACMPRPRSLRTGMLGKQPRRPQFVRIAELLGLAAGQINQPYLGFERNCRLTAGRGRSSSAAIGPSTAARSTQRCTVW